MQDHGDAAGPWRRGSRRPRRSRSVSPSGSRAWITIGSPSSAAISIWASKARRWSPGVGAVAVVVEPGLADRPHLLVGGRGAAISRRQRRRRIRPPRSGGSRPSRRPPRGARPRRSPPRWSRRRGRRSASAPPRPPRAAASSSSSAARRGRGGCGSRSPAAQPIPAKWRQRLLAHGRFADYSRDYMRSRAKPRPPARTGSGRARSRAEPPLRIVRRCRPRGDDPSATPKRVGKPVSHRSDAARVVPRAGADDLLGTMRSPTAALSANGAASTARRLAVGARPRSPAPPRLHAGGDLSSPASQGCPGSSI